MEGFATDTSFARATDDESVAHNSGSVVTAPVKPEDMECILDTGIGTGMHTQYWYSGMHGTGWFWNAQYWMVPEHMELHRSRMHGTGWFWTA